MSWGRAGGAEEQQGSDSGWGIEVKITPSRDWKLLVLRWHQAEGTAGAVTSAGTAHSHLSVPGTPHLGWHFRESIPVGMESPVVKWGRKHNPSIQLVKLQCQGWVDVALLGARGWGQRPAPALAWVRRCQGEMGVPGKLLRAPGGCAKSDSSSQRETGRKKAGKRWETVRKLAGNKQENWEEGGRKTGKK